MKRVLAYALGLVVLALLVLSQAVHASDDASSGTDTASITDYTADFTVARNGDLSVTEKITVSFPYGKHGIFRFFDLRDPNDFHARLRPREVKVRRDGVPEQFEELKEGHDRYRNLKIGNPYVTVTPGAHIYQIDYRVDGVVAKGTDGTRSQFYWDLIPAGWQMPIGRSTLTVHLPTKVEKVRCAVGAGKTSGCTATGTGTNTLVVRTGALEPHTPVTVKAGIDLPTPDRGDTRPWSQRLDPVLGPNLPTLLVVLLLGLLGAVTGAVTAARTREKKPPFPLQYAPPEGIGPAQGQYILTETVPREAFVASFMEQAAQGAATLDTQGNGDWTIADKGDFNAWKQLDPISAYAGQLLGVQGGTFTAKKKSVTAGRQLKSAISQFESGVKLWARQNNLMVPSGLGSLSGAAVVVAIIATVGLALWNPFNMSVVALVPGLWALFALSLLAPGAGTRRTASGRDLWSRVGGFHRVLSTPSSEQRFDFSGRKELYTAYIPWAVAFDCADAWAEKYRTETAEEPPVPSYFAGGYAAGSLSNGVSTMVDDFSSTVDSAISSYQATQSSSSSGGGGGGGFSGGGGGGGGGGGSW